MSNLLVKHSDSFSPANSAWVAKMKVSIVIPCYNERDMIEKIVEVFRNAPLQSREIIVVDDFSQDGRQTVLRESVFPDG